MYIIQTFPSYCCFGISIHFSQCVCVSMCVFVCVCICAWRCGGSGRLCRGSLSIDLRVCCVGFVYDHVSDHYVLCGICL